MVRTRRRWVCDGIGAMLSVSLPGCRQHAKNRLTVLTAAVMRQALQPIVRRFRQATGFEVDLRLGGSNYLLSTLRLTQSGDVFVSADRTYLDMAAAENLTEPPCVIASVRPVIVVHQAANESLQTMATWWSIPHRIAIADPDAAAVGRATRLMFERHHVWADLVERISNDGVTLPTVGVVASAVKLGSVHSGIVWDVTAEQFGFSRIIDHPLMQGGRSQVAIAACRGAANPDAAKAFVDFVCDDVKSRQTLEQNGFALD